MSTFWLQVFVQAPIIAVLWWVVARDAAGVKRRTGSAPMDISAFAWGALAGLTWVAVVPYVVARRAALQKAPAAAGQRERNLGRLWVLLSAAAAVWTFTNISSGDANNGTQHAILTVLLAGTGVLALARDRAATVPPQPSSAS